MTRDELEFSISQYLDGTLGARERDALESGWRRDAEARALYAEYESLQRVLTAAPLPEVRWDQFAAQISGAVAREEMPQQSYKIGQWLRPARLAIAASVLVAAGIAFTLLKPGTKPGGRAGHQRADRASCRSTPRPPARRTRRHRAREPGAHPHRDRPVRQRGQRDDLRARTRTGSCTARRRPSLSAPPPPGKIAPRRPSNAGRLARARALGCTDTPNSFRVIEVTLPRAARDSFQDAPMRHTSRATLVALLLTSAVVLAPLTDSVVAAAGQLRADQRGARQARRGRAEDHAPQRAQRDQEPHRRPHRARARRARAAAVGRPDQPQPHDQEPDPPPGHRRHRPHARPRARAHARGRRAAPDARAAAARPPRDGRGAQGARPARVQPAQPRQAARAPPSRSSSKPSTPGCWRSTASSRSSSARATR